MTQNPLETVLTLLEGYRNSIQDTLRVNGLSTDDADYVFKRMEIDRDVYLSLNRAYKLSDERFTTFAQRVGLDAAMFERSLQP